VLTQPKRLALLAYLARANSSGFRRRDTLVALFWPDLDEAHARGALRQALRFLRRALGDGVIVTRGEEEVGVDGAALWCDATAFAAACDAGRTAEAVELYHGDFLEGFHVSDAAPELEQWLEEERAGLRRRAVEAAWTEAERLRAAGERSAAMERARRAAALAPDDEAAQARLMALLDEAGDRAGALEVSERFARRLRDNYEVEPAPETRDLIERIRARTAPHAPPAPPAPPDTTGVGTPTVSAAASSPARGEPASRSRVPARLVTVVGVGALAVAVWMVVAARSSPTPRLDQNLVAVLPFRTAGLDSTYGEGMVDLLSATLTGDGGPRAVSPQLVMRAWSRARPPADGPRRLGRTLGAGRVVQGSIVRTPEGVAVQADLFQVPGGEVVGQARAAGPPDSLIALVDRIAAQLLATWSGETGRRLKALAGSSPGALKAYLQGMQAYRRGQYDVADAHFNRALDLDSTFVLAALGQANAGLWLDRPDRGVAVAWAMRDRLSADERAQVMALAADVIVPDRATPRAVLTLRERAVGVAPDRPEAWFLLGDQLHHMGSVLGVRAWRDRSMAAFWHALEFDSTLAGPLEHLLESGASIGDTATVRRVAARVLANDSPLADYYRWLIAQTLGDTAALGVLRGRFERMDSFNRTSILIHLWRQSAADDFDRVVAIERRHAASPGDLDRLLFRRLRMMLLNAGRPVAWRVEMDAARDIAELAPSLPLMEILDALYWGGDTMLAEQAARRLAPGAASHWAAEGVTPLVADGRACALAQWGLRVGRFASARRIARELAGTPRPFAVSCAAILDALIAAAEDRSDAPAALERLDSLMREGLPPMYGNLVVARLREAQGDVPSALAAARRSPRNQPGLYLSTFLREEGRLASLAGDRAGAERAFTEYLALRFNPEPATAEEIQQVRASLARLVSERR
jgi:DNA-binding SARP family transcriptional activator/TolB-like protein